MKKQTAVEWLVEQIEERRAMPDGENIKPEIIQQAKAMEKEQIEDAYWDGYQNIPSMKPEQYYNEIYGN